MSVTLSDRRFLGAVRLLDGTTGLPIHSPLKMEAEGVRLVQNRSGLFVLFSVRGFEEYGSQFQNPLTPVLSIEDRTFTFTVRDPSREYLPRQFSLLLPRDLDPGHKDQANSLFGAVDVKLYPAPSAAVGSAWATVRISVMQAGTGTALSGAYLRILRDDNAKLLATGYTDERGEALVAVPEIPITTSSSGSGPVVVKEVDATLSAFFKTGEMRSPPNPDDLEAKFSGFPTSSAPVRLASGRSLSLTLEVPAA